VLSEKENGSALRLVLKHLNLAGRSLLRDHAVADIEFLRKKSIINSFVFIFYNFRAIGEVIEI
jgi:hypothetical protein